MSFDFYYVSLPWMVTLDGEAVPLSVSNPGIRVWARSADDAVAKVVDSLASLIDSEVSGNIVRREPTSG